MQLRRWMPLLAVCLGSFLFVVDTTVVTVALPAIGADLAAPLVDLEWVATGYPLVLAVLMLAAGAVADRLGLRRALLAGLGAFAAASLGCALAPGLGWLVAARAAQGIGGAALAVTGFALLATTYAGRERGTAFGVFFAVNALGGAAGPLLGGLLTATLGWRSIFLLNLPVAAAAAVLTAVAFQRSVRRAGRVDVAGTAAFATAAAALTIGLTRIADHGLDVAAVVGLGVAAVAAVAFLRIEARRPDGLLDVALLRQLPFATALTGAGVWSVAFAALVYTSVWLQGTLGLDPLAAGVALLPLAAATAIASMLSGRLLHGVAPRIPLGVGLLLSGIGCALQGASAQPDPWSIAPGLLVTGLGIGIAGPAIAGAVMATVIPEQAGRVSGLMTTVRQLGQTLGVAALGIVFAGAAPGTGLGRVGAVAAGLALLAGTLALLVRPARASSLDQAPRR
ncbi:MFS transporter [Pseudonocardia sp. GCM10023141]|uniref:MFS transporter n=1 Tax=Pseudonocardia sp. GCM10023141 TaxID=3252653 RepID=UPI0036085B6D